MASKVGMANIGRGGWQSITLDLVRILVMRYPPLASKSNQLLLTNYRAIDYKINFC